MKIILLAGSMLFSALASASGAVIAEWDFNSVPADEDAATGTLRPSSGVGNARLIGNVSDKFAAGDATSDPVGASDNSAWHTAGYPSLTSSNKSSGVEFMVDTSGYENIRVRWSQRNSSTASRYARLQCTVDGNHFVDADVIALYVESVFTNVTCDLSQTSGLSDNPSFGFRIVTEFASTALGTGPETYAATKAGSSYSGMGTIRFDMVTVSGTPIAGENTRPVISALPMQTLRVNQSTDAIEFSVRDGEGPPEALIVTAASSNPVVVPESNIRLGGWSTTRTVTIRAGDHPGVSTITLFVTDTGGKTASTCFTVTVLPADAALFISRIPATNALMNSEVLAVPFTIGDAEAEADALVVSAMSANPVLVPNDATHLFLNGAGSNRFVQVAPVFGQAGVAPITVTVADGTNSASSAFALMVTPSASVVLYDPFDYHPGSLLTNSAFLWQTRSGTSGQCQVISGHLQITASQTEDVVTSLVGGPYTRNQGMVLYASFKARFLSLPRRTPGYFAHFGDGSMLRGRIYAVASASLPGCFRLAVANGSSTNTALAVNLSTNTIYTFVTRYNVDTATATLWVNPRAESDPSVTATDSQSVVSIASYGFRQDADIGATVLIDDLKVGLSFAAVATTVLPGGRRLIIEHANNKMVLRWFDTTMTLQSAPNATGVFTDISGATSPFTVLETNSMWFFRLR